MDIQTIEKKGKAIAWMTSLWRYQDRPMSELLVHGKEFIDVNFEAMRNAMPKKFFWVGLMLILQIVFLWFSPLILFVSVVMIVISKSTHFFANIFAYIFAPIRFAAFLLTRGESSANFWSYINGMIIVEAQIYAIADRTGLNPHEFNTLGQFLKAAEKIEKEKYKKSGQADIQATLNGNKPKTNAELSSDDWVKLPKICSVRSVVSNMIWKPEKFIDYAIADVKNSNYKYAVIGLIGSVMAAVFFTVLENFSFLAWIGKVIFIGSSVVMIYGVFEVIGAFISRPAILYSLLMSLNSRQFKPDTSSYSGIGAANLEMEKFNAEKTFSADKSTLSNIQQFMIRYGIPPSLEVISEAQYIELSQLYSSEGLGAYQRHYEDYIMNDTIVKAEKIEQERIEKILSSMSPESEND